MPYTDYDPGNRSQTRGRDNAALEARTVSPATPKPCARCPWRTSNHGKRHPGGWYTKANLRRLWTGLRRGLDMTCHPTDPGNPVTPSMVSKGVKPAPENAHTTECAGALILKQREFMRYQAIVDSHPEADARECFRHYRRAHPRGLTLNGLRAVLERAMFGGTPLGGQAMSRPNLNEPGIGHPDLVPWAANETRAKEKACT